MIRFYLKIDRAEILIGYTAHSMFAGYCSQQWPFRNPLKNGLIHSILPQHGNLHKNLSGLMISNFIQFNRMGAFKFVCVIVLE